MGGLVLSRRLNEVILIGDAIRIEVIEIRGSDVVRLLITAPKETTVHRKEVADAIAKQTRRSKYAAQFDALRDSIEGNPSQEECCE